MNCDQRYGFGRGWITKPFDNTGTRQAHTTLWPALLSFDQFAVSCAQNTLNRNHPFLTAGLIRGDNPATFGTCPENTQDPFGIGSNAADKTRLVGGIIQLRQPRQNAIATAQSRVRRAVNDQNFGLFAFTMPFHWLRIKIAIFIGGFHHQHANRGQPIPITVGFLARFQMPFGLKLL